MLAAAGRGGAPGSEPHPAGHSRLPTRAPLRPGRRLRPRSLPGPPPRRGGTPAGGARSRPGSRPRTPAARAWGAPGAPGPRARRSHEVSPARARPATLPPRPAFVPPPQPQLARDRDRGRDRDRDRGRDGVSNLLRPSAHPDRLLGQPRGAPRVSPLLGAFGLGCRGGGALQRLPGFSTLSGDLQVGRDSLLEMSRFLERCSPPQHPRAQLGPGEAVGDGLGEILAPSDSIGLGSRAKSPPSVGAHLTPHFGRHFFSRSPSSNLGSLR